VGQDERVTEQPRSPLDAALDLVFYAPVGLALTAREELPRLIEKGRQRVTGQVTMAKVIGQFAVTQGGQEAGKFFKQATEALIGLGVLPGAGPPVRPGPAAGPPGSSSVTDAPSNGSRAGTPVAAANPDELGILGYDALSASQVVQRLAGLSDQELDAVQAYEAATRGRRTILARIAQVQADRA
jgi:hypothetical protein